MSQARAIAGRTLGDSRVRDGVFALFFLVFAYVNPVGYRSTYPTVAERLAFARSFGTNKAVTLFYGIPHDLVTTGGFTAWRFGGFTAILAAVWGVLAAVRALRGEEDAGRQELVLAGAVSRRAAYLAVLAAASAAAAILALAIFVGLVAGRLAAGGSAYLTLAVISPALVFAGAGALASQLAPTRRMALGISMGTLGLAFLLRVVADTATGAGWIRWATPLGWSEEVRAFADPRPWVLVLPAVATAALFAAAGAIAVKRDVGTGILQSSDRADADLRLLSSPTAFALRSARGSFAGWLAGVGIFALIVGVLSTSFTSANISKNLQEQLSKIGGASITTPAGAIGFYFLIFVLAVSLYACGQVATVRREEADQQLETLFAQPIDRRRWLGGRLLLAAASAAALALTAGVLAWAGAAAQHAHVSLLRLLEAGANCLPTALLFLGLAALTFAFVPRATAGVAYGLVTLAFVWDLFGAFLGLPHWLLQLTPFEHIGLVPSQPFHAGAAAAMLGIGVTAGLAAVRAFARRDLVAA